MVDKGKPSAEPSIGIFYQGQPCSSGEYTISVGTDADGGRILIPAIDFSSDFAVDYEASPPVQKFRPNQTVTPKDVQKANQPGPGKTGKSFKMVGTLTFEDRNDKGDTVNLKNIFIHPSGLRQGQRDESDEEGLRGVWEFTLTDCRNWWDKRGTVYSRWNVIRDSSSKKVVRGSQIALTQDPEKEFDPRSLRPKGGKEFGEYGDGPLEPWTAKEVIFDVIQRELYAQPNIVFKGWPADPKDKTKRVKQGPNSIPINVNLGWVTPKEALDVVLDRMGAIAFYNPAEHTIFIQPEKIDDKTDLAELWTTGIPGGTRKWSKIMHYKPADVIIRGGLRKVERLDQELIPIMTDLNGEMLPLAEILERWGYDIDKVARGVLVSGQNADAVFSDVPGKDDKEKKARRRLLANKAFKWFRTTDLGLLPWEDTIVQQSPVTGEPLLPQVYSATVIEFHANAKGWLKDLTQQSFDIQEEIDITTRSITLNNLRIDALVDGKYVISVINTDAITDINEALSKFKNFQETLDFDVKTVSNAAGKKRKVTTFTIDWPRSTEVIIASIESIKRSNENLEERVRQLQELLDGVIPSLKQRRKNFGRTYSNPPVGLISPDEYSIDSRRGIVKFKKPQVRVTTFGDGGPETIRAWGAPVSVLHAFRPDTGSELDYTVARMNSSFEISNDWPDKTTSESLVIHVEDLIETRQMNGVTNLDEVNEKALEILKSKLEGTSTGIGWELVLNSFRSEVLEEMGMSVPMVQFTGDTESARTLVNIGQFNGILGFRGPNRKKGFAFGHYKGTATRRRGLSKASFFGEQ